MPLVHRRPFFVMRRGSSGPRPAAACFRRIVNPAPIGIGLRLLERRFLPLRDEGTINFDFLPACKSPTLINAICDVRAPTAACTSRYNPNSSEIA